MLRRSVGRKIGRGCCRRKALSARPDRHSNHVLLQSLVVADAGVAARCQHIDETFLHHQFHPDIGIGAQEGRENGRQDRNGDPGGDVESENAGRPIATKARFAPLNVWKSDDWL